MSRPKLPPPPFEGGCLCGQARYAYKARPLATNACHCTDCKKLSGATHIHMVLADSAAFSHVAGEVARWRKRADSGREVDIVRCANCGVRMWHEPLASPQYVFIAAGTLDDASWFRPASHIWTASAAPDFAFEDDALIVERQPETRQVLIDAFNKLYPE
jgi:hypothetical protein